MDDMTDEMTNDFLEFQLNELKKQIPALKLKDLSKGLTKSDSGNSRHLNIARTEILLNRLDSGGPSNQSFPNRPWKSHSEDSEPAESVEFFDVSATYSYLETDDTVEFDIADLYSSSDELLDERREPSPISFFHSPEREHTPPPPSYAAPATIKSGGKGISIPLSVDTQRTKFLTSNKSEISIPLFPPPKRPSRAGSFSSSLSADYEGATSPNLTVSPKKITPVSPGKKIALNFVNAEESLTPPPIETPVSGYTFPLGERKRYDSASFMNSPSPGSFLSPSPYMHEHSSPSAIRPRVVSASTGTALRLSIYTGMEDNRHSTSYDSRVNRSSSAPVTYLPAGRSIVVIKKEPDSDQCMPINNRGRPKRKPAPRMSQGMKARGLVFSKIGSRNSNVRRSAPVISDTVELHVRIPEVKKLMKLTVDRTILWEVLRQLIRTKFIEKFGKKGKKVMNEKRITCGDEEISSHGDWALCLDDYSGERVIYMELS
jgi:hypothetical protein